MYGSVDIGPAESDACVAVSGEIRAAARKLDAPVKSPVADFSVADTLSSIGGATACEQYEQGCK
jgi:hypothetical protein